MGFQASDERWSRSVTVSTMLGQMTAGKVLSFLCPHVVIRCLAGTLNSHSASLLRFLREFGTMSSASGVRQAQRH